MDNKRAHELLVHYDGSACTDGCDREAHPVLRLAYEHGVPEAQLTALAAVEAEGGLYSHRRCDVCGCWPQAIDSGHLPDGRAVCGYCLQQLHPRRAWRDPRHPGLCGHESTLTPDGHGAYCRWCGEVLS